jgi:hypothetical protein
MPRLPSVFSDERRFLLRNQWPGAVFGNFTIKEY